MSYALKVIKDNPLMFLPLDEISGTLASDISGCGNDGTHTYSIIPDGMPLIPGGTVSNKITHTRYIQCSLLNNYYGQEQTVSFGQAGFSDNDFSMEVWIYPNFNISENIVFADDSNNVGIFWESGNIIFKLDSEILEYTVPYYKKALHIVAVYNVNNMMIYVDGIAVASKQISLFKFTNTNLNISIGPTQASDSYFIVDAPAIYRYGLSPDQIYSHYIAAQQQIMPIHIVSPDNGYLFTLSDENTRELGYMTYPTIRPWQQFVVDGISLDRVTNSLYLTPTDSAESAEVVIKDVISVPYQDTMTRSKISWVGDNGITVETSIDDETYVECVNGEQVPQYIDGIDNGNGQLYIKITFTSEDASRFNPELSLLNISFYLTNKLYASNSPDFVEVGSGAGFVVGSKNYPVLSRDHRNGLRAKASNLFETTLSRDLKSIEMIYIRMSSGSAGGFIHSGSTVYSWSSGGTVTKSNISAIYVDGEDVTSETDIDSFLLVGNPYHIVIVLSSSLEADGVLAFNSNSSEVSSDGIYKNIAMYDIELDSSKVLEHFDLYRGRPSVVANDTTITISENDPEVHNNDWIVIKSI